MCVCKSFNQFSECFPSDRLISILFIIFSFSISFMQFYEEGGGNFLLGLLKHCTHLSTCPFVGKCLWDTRQCAVVLLIRLIW